MDGPGLLRAGIALSVIGLVASLASGAVGELRIIASLSALFGLVLLLLAIYALVSPPRMPALVLAGAALFVLGRLAIVVMRSTGTFEPLTGTAMDTAASLGLILLLVGIFQAVRGRGAAVPARAVAPATAPAASAPARASAIRPPRAPLPTRPLDPKPPK
jgi:hypothetical protein